MLVPPTLAGPILPVAAMTMVWCAANAEAIIRLFMVFPVKGKYLALFEVGVVFFMFGMPNPIRGLFIVAPLALFWFVGTGKVRLPLDKTKPEPRFLKKQEREFDRYRDDIHRRSKEREEQQKLRKLFESSLIDDPEDKKRD